MPISRHLCALVQPSKAIRSVTMYSLHYLSSTAPTSTARAITTPFYKQVNASSALISGLNKSQDSPPFSKSPSDSLLAINLNKLDIIPNLVAPGTLAALHRRRPARRAAALAPVELDRAPGEARRAPQGKIDAQPARDLVDARRQGRARRGRVGAAALPAGSAGVVLHQDPLVVGAGGEEGEVGGGGGGVGDEEVRDGGLLFEDGGAGDGLGEGEG